MADVCTVGVVCNALLVTPCRESVPEHKLEFSKMLNVACTRAATDCTGFTDQVLILFWYVFEMALWQPSYANQQLLCC